jgi:hypothetical protein
MDPDRTDEPKPAAFAAHPLSIGEILAASFRLYATRFVPFLAISFTLCVPFGIAVGIILLRGAGEPPPKTEGLFETLGSLVSRAAGLLGIALAFWLLVFPLAKAVLARQVASALEGEPTSGMESLRRSLPRLPLVLAAHLLAQAAVAAGLLLLVAPGIFLGLWFLLVPETVALEGAGIIEAFRKSVRRVRREMRKAALLALAVVLISGIIVGNLLGLLRLAALPAFLAVFLHTAIAALVLPIQAVPLILLYLDLRAREAVPQVAMPAAAGPPPGPVD